MRQFTKLVVPDRGPPLVQFLIKEMNQQQCSHTILEYKSGVSQNTVRQWVTVRRTPTLAHMVAVLGALGYDLVTKEKR